MQYRYELRNDGRIENVLFKVVGRSSNSTGQRNVVLFDLDCFYAQCYCIRYGLDVTTTALALFQWNSILAVTYPPQKLYNIQRGDTWENVATKSQQKCI